MSIYSGFHSRKLQQKYNNLVVETLEVLTKIVVNCLGKIKIEPFEKQLRRVVKNIQKMDAIKSFDPKFSLSLKPLSTLFFQEQRPRTVSDEPHRYQAQLEKRPMSGKYLLKEKGKSLQLNRNTIHIDSDFVKKNTSQHFDTFHKKAKQINISMTQNVRLSQKLVEHAKNVTMEELMQSNRLIERKMTLYRKKKHVHSVQQSRIYKITQLQQEDELEIV